MPGPTLREQLINTLDAARAINVKAVSESRDLTARERTEVQAAISEAERIKALIQRADADTALLDKLKGMGDDPTVDAGTMKVSSPTSDRETPGWLATVADPSRARATVKAMNTNGTGVKALASGSITIVEHDPVNVRIPEAPQTFMQLLGSSTTTTGEVSYLRQTVRTNNAAPVAAGALKPTSVYTVVKVTDTLKTIAHLSEAIPRQYFEDDDSLESFIGGEMVLGVAEEVVDQCINGAGTGENFMGVLTVSGTLSQAYATSVLLTLRKALTRLENTSITPTAYVLNPTDWEAVEMLAGSDGHFVADGLPTDPGRRMLFGVPVVTAPQLAAGEGILGDWRQAVLRRRGGVALTWTEMNDTNWEYNLVRWRAEIRATLAIKQPAAFVVADLTP